MPLARVARHVLFPSIVLTALVSAGCHDSSSGTVTGPVSNPPTITTQPAAQTVPLGGTAAFTVVAAGDSLSTQWFKNGTALSGQVFATLTFPAVAVTDSGKYWAVVSNSLGSVSSDTVALVILVPAGITGYKQSGGSFSTTNARYTSTTADQSAVYVSSGGDLTLVAATISKFGNASSLATSAQNGTNAAVRVDSAATVTMVDATVSSDSAGAAGVFATGAGSGIAVFRGSITTNGISSPAVAATAGGTISLENTIIGATSGTLVSATGSSIVTFVTDSENLTGSLLADVSSTVSASLQHGTTLTGAIQHAALSLDSSSTWIVTANSTVTALTLAAGVSGTSVTSIIGNGHTVFYSAAASPALGSKTYTLAGGGSLVPQ
jgi:hypothetical protein